MTNAELTRWDEAKAQAWFTTQPWLCGFNYVPSTAVNSTEMWQRDTFDLQTITRELSWAAAAGFNSCRIFLQYLVWENDPQALLERVDTFLDAAAKHHISTTICLFDDVSFAGKPPYLGKQNDPVPGVHNSGWTPSPAHEWVVDPLTWPRLQAYVASVVSAFANDERVIIWDLYNEPGNDGICNESIGLLNEAFRWARDANPTQPLTTAIWRPDPSMLEMPEQLADQGDSDKQEVNWLLSWDPTPLHDAILALSDVVSFHDYGPVQALEARIARLKPLNRPLLCTEWMARTLDSTFQTHLPIFKREGIGCYCWGLVQGKTQTYLPWGWTPSPEQPDPEVWHHDLFYPDGKPYREEEIQVIQEHTALTPPGRTSTKVEKTGNPYRIRVLERAIRLLFTLSDGEPRALTEVAADIGLNNTTTFRLLATLEEYRLVKRDPDSGAYRLGAACVQLARAALKSFDVHQASIPTLKELRDHTEETVHLATLEEMEVFYLEKLPGFHAIGVMSSRVGTFAPAYCTALGKALLAFLPEDEVRAYFAEHSLMPVTANTITDPSILIAQLREVREKGYALDLGEREPDIYCVAAPILADGNQALAALSVSGPAYRMASKVRQGELVQIVREAARSISLHITETRKRIVRGQVRKFVLKG